MGERFLDSRRLGTNSRDPVNVAGLLALGFLLGEAGFQGGQCDDNPGEVVVAGRRLGP